MREDDLTTGNINLTGKYTSEHTCKLTRNAWASRVSVTYITQVVHKTEKSYSIMVMVIGFFNELRRK